MTFTILFFLSFFSNAHAGNTFLALLDEQSLRPPTCAAELSGPRGPIGRYAVRRFQRAMDDTELDWLWAYERDGRFASARRWAHYAANQDRLAQLYLHVLRLNEDLPGLIHWLQAYFYSADVRTDPRTEHESFKGGQDQKSTRRHDFIAAYLSHPNLEATVERDGMMVVMVSQTIVERGVIYGEQYGGEMGRGDLYLIKGARALDGLSVVREVIAGGDRNVIDAAISEGKIVSHTEVGKGRAVMRYGPRAGDIRYVDREILGWNKQGVSASCVYDSTGQAVVVGCVYPFVQVRHFAASRWVRALRGL